MSLKNFSFKVKNKDKFSRTGTIITSRGNIDTPVFMPVGTQATVKATFIDDLIKAESVWLTSSTKGLAPVSEIVNQNSNLDVSHPLFKKCQNIFKDAFFKE